jgi:molecular chaperone GrpE (heat shock protein)
MQESMVEVPDPSKPSGTVAMTSQTGYTIKGRLLRSAKVCVYRS